MATLHARADGDWTDAATWALVHPTGTLDAQNANTALTTTFVSSSAFTPGAVTLDGIAVKIASRNATPTGTISVRLAVGGVAVAGTTVTINVSDIPNNINNPQNTYAGCTIGWFFFRFASPVTLLAATNYTLQASTSSANQVNLFRDGTVGNWARLLRTTTTQAPGAGDALFIGGEWTAAGTVTARTVTYNETATTDYGTASTILASIGVSKGGTLTLETDAATAYRLRLSGHLMFWQESVGTFGTSGTPLPADSTFLCEFDCAADIDFGLVAYAPLELHGSDPFGTGITRTRLTADASATDTTLTVADATGWLSGDPVVIAGTTRNATHAEARILDGDAGPSSMAITVGLTNAHAGNAAWKAQADVINLRRPITFTTTSATAVSFIYLRGGFDLTADWVAFYYMGHTNRAGYDVGGGTHRFTDCAFAYCEDDWFTPVTLSATVIECVRCQGWQFGQVSTGAFFTSATNNTNVARLTDCTIIGGGLASSFGFNIGTGGVCELSGTRLTGHGSGNRFDALLRLSAEACEVYNCGSSAFFINASNLGVRVDDALFWRNAGSPSVVNSYDVEFDGCEFFGNTIDGISLDDSQVSFHACVFDSETGFAQLAGVTITGGENDAGQYVWHDCAFSQGGGNRIAATTDVNFTTTSVRWHMTFSGTVMGAATEIATTTLREGSTLAIQRRNGTIGANSFRRYGYGQIDFETSTVDVSPGVRLTPQIAAGAPLAFDSTRMGVAVASGAQPTFTVRVRPNGTYAGEPAVLVLKANGALGVPRDVILDTHSGAADTWETLSGQLPAAAEEDGIAEVVVRVTGNAGAVFVDTFTAA